MLLFLVLFFHGCYAQQPACKDPPGNNAVADLIIDGIEAFRPYMNEGIPALGIPPLDPLGPLPVIPFVIDSTNVYVYGTVNDTVVKNLAQFIICEVTIEIGVTQKFFIDLRMDNFHMDGLYNLNGVAYSLFPIFGNGIYRIDAYNSGFSGGATVTYNVLTDIAQIKDLILDIFFESLELFFECILGCGEMSDLVNSVINEIAPGLFDAIWHVIKPILEDALEALINDILKDIHITEILPQQKNLLISLVK